jgi:GntR family transcriptional repressor for pyruvate dehydrogenase complex
MRGALGAMASSIEEGGDGIEGDRRFHRAIVDAAHNDLLKHLIGQISDVVDRTSEASLTLPGRPPTSLQAHHEILAAIEQRDEVNAAEAMRRHVNASAQGVTSRATPS